MLLKNKDGHILYGVCLGERGRWEKITEGQNISDGWCRKEAWPQQPSGRFQLVMETGVAHPAA